MSARVVPCGSWFRVHIPRKHGRPPLGSYYHNRASEKRLMQNERRRLLTVCRKLPGFFNLYPAYCNGEEDGRFWTVTMETEEGAYKLFFMSATLR